MTYQFIAFDFFRELESQSCDSCSRFRLVRKLRSVENTCCGECLMHTTTEISMASRDRYEHLQTILKQMGKVLVAFSGGVDSTLLLKAASGYCWIKGRWMFFLPRYR